MIIQEREKEWELVKQHDHALVSWQIAKSWKSDLFSYSAKKKDVLLAIRHHDRAWISLDEEVRWNQEKEEPYGFTTYPLIEKVEAYKNGVDEVEAISPYAALLCSRHYTSFFSMNENTPSITYQFLKEEEQRRENIKDQLNGKITEEEIKEHVKILQFSDDLSLYICLNPPGVTKEEEFPWFKDGFRQRFFFAPDGMKAEWRSESIIALTPFPLVEDTEITLPVYKLDKTKDRKTVIKQWAEALPEKRKIKLKALPFNGI